MKRIIAIAMTFVSVSAFSQDAGVGDLAREFRQATELEFNDIEESMNLKIKEYSPSFPDYGVAAQSLLIKMQESRAKFHTSLKGVEDFLSWYEALFNLYDQDPNNRALQQLLKRKKKELSLQRSLYTESALRLTVIDDVLSMPVSISPRPGRYLPASLIAIGAIATPVGLGVAGAAIMVGEGAFLLPIMITSLALMPTGIKIGVDEKPINVSQFAIAGAVKNSNGEVIYNSNKGSMTARAYKQKVLEKVAQRVFEKCTTQGCVYYLAEDLINWVEQTSKMTKRLEIPIKGIKDFRFKLPVAKYKYRKAIDEMADFAASTRPVSF